MITANQKKFVKSLAQKKFRKQHGCFVIEGVKMVEEALASDFEINAIYGSKFWMESNPGQKAELVSNKELQQLSFFKSPNEVMAVVKMKEFDKSDYQNKLTLVLDYVQDPGNMGTIIRTADWFGIDEIVCSSDTVDCYNPKVVQASMGSIFRVRVRYVNLQDFFEEHKNLRVYGAKLDGKSLKESDLNAEGGVVLLGNESKGVSPKLDGYITDAIAIDKLGGAESLNVASAAAVLCYAFRT